MTIDIVQGSVCIKREVIEPITIYGSLRAVSVSSDGKQGQPTYHISDGIGRTLGACPPSRHDRLGPNEKLWPTRAQDNWRADGISVDR